MTMRDALIKWNGINDISVMRQETAVMEISAMSAVKPEYLPYIGMYNVLVKDYAAIGDLAIKNFITDIQKRPYEDFVEFTKANNIDISLQYVDNKTGKTETIPDPEAYLLRELPRYLRRTRGSITPAILAPEIPYKPVLGKTTRIDEFGRVITEEVIPWKNIQVERPGMPPLPKGIIQVTPTSTTMPEIADIEARKERAKAETSFAPITYGKASPVCEAMPGYVTNQMIDLSEKSTRIGTEFGAVVNLDRTQYGGAFLPDMSLTNIIEGNNLGVEIPRSENTEGTFHTHPFGDPNPSAGDLQDMMIHNDKLMCIGATGKAGTKIKCFSPNEPVFTQLKDEFAQLATDIGEFNTRAEEFLAPGGKYTQFHETHIGHKGAAQSKRVRAMIRELPALIATVPYNEAAHKEAIEAANNAELQASKARFASDRLESDALHLSQIYEKGLDNMLNRKFTSVEDIRFANQALLPVMERAKKANALADTAVGRAEATELFADKLREQEIALRPSPITQQNEITALIGAYSELNTRRDHLKDKIERQVRLILLPDKFRPGEKNPLMPEGGTFRPEELMLQSCRLMWESLRENLVYETEAGELITFHPEDL